MNTQNLKGVGANDKVRDIQTHLLSGIARKNISKITRWNGECDRPRRGPQGQPGPKIIRNLRHNPDPVDRVDRRQALFCPESLIVEQRLYLVLTVVKRPLKSDIVDIACRNRRHLPALNL